jgi:uncharacterized protein
MMRIASLRNSTRGTDVALACGLADNFWLRLRGLLGRPPLEAGQGLLITPCRAVHMLGMKYAIDVVFLKRDWRVVGLESGLRPGGKSRWYRGARHALELPTGTIANTRTEVGDLLSLEPIARRTASGPSATAVSEAQHISGAA